MPARTSQQTSPYNRDDDSSHPRLSRRLFRTLSAVLGAAAVIWLAACAAPVADVVGDSSLSVTQEASQVEPTGVATQEASQAEPTEVATQAATPSASLTPEATPDVSEATPEPTETAEAEEESSIIEINSFEDLANTEKALPENYLELLPEGGLRAVAEGRGLASESDTGEGVYAFDTKSMLLLAKVLENGEWFDAVWMPGTGGAIDGSKDVEVWGEVTDTISDGETTIHLITAEGFGYAFDNASVPANPDLLPKEAAVTVFTSLVHEYEEKIIELWINEYPGLEGKSVYIFQMPDDVSHDSFYREDGAISGGLGNVYYSGVTKFSDLNLIHGRMSTSQYRTNDRREFDYTGGASYLAIFQILSQAIYGNDIPIGPMQTEDRFSEKFWDYLQGIEGPASLQEWIITIKPVEDVQNQ